MSLLLQNRTILHRLTHFIEAADAFPEKKLSVQSSVYSNERFLCAKPTLASHEVRSQICEQRYFSGISFGETKTDTGTVHLVVSQCKPVYCDKVGMPGVNISSQ